MCATAIRADIFWEIGSSDPSFAAAPGVYQAISLNNGVPCDDDARMVKISRFDGDFENTTTSYQFPKTVGPLESARHFYEERHRSVNFFHRYANLP